MTDPTDFDQSEAPLPGLEPAHRGAPLLELATRRTIAALVETGQAGEQHAMQLQLMIELARVVDAGRRQGKASAAAMAAAQLLATYAQLVPEVATGGEHSDAFDELAADLRRAANVHNTA